MTAYTNKKTRETVTLTQKEADRFFDNRDPNEWERADAAVMTPRVIYLSGPMTGYPDFNYPAFNAAAARLRSEGHRVYNPAEFPHNGDPKEFPLRVAFASFCNFICLEADTICLLPGWEDSIGVTAELALAKNCKLDIADL